MKSKKGQENYRLVSLTYIPVMVIEQILQESISKHLKDKEGTANCQHKLNKGKFCPSNLGTFYNDMAGLFG